MGNSNSTTGRSGNSNRNSTATQQTSWSWLAPAKVRNGRVEKRRSKTYAPDERPSLAEELSALRTYYRKGLIDDEVAVKIFKELNVSDKFFKSGKVLAWTVQPDDPDFLDIYKYVANSEEEFQLNILSILRIIPNATALRQSLDFNEDPQTKDMFRMLLWHGTKKRFVTSILENGLKLPTHHSACGAGIYFADRIAKSCRYVDYCSENGVRTAYFLLCDVLLGEMFKMNTYNTSLTAPPNNKNSVKVCGRYIPNPSEHKTVDGCQWPIGKTKRGWCSLRLPYSEYVVYNRDQVMPKYLVKVEI